MSILVLLLCKRIEYQAVLTEYKDWRLLNISSVDIVTKAQPNYVFLLSEKEGQFAYRITSDHSSHKASEISKFKIEDPDWSPEKIFNAILDDEIKIDENLSMDYPALRTLISNSELIASGEWKLKDPKYSWLERIEESFMIILFFIGISSVILILKLILLRALKIKPILLDLIILSLITTFIYVGTTPNWYAHHKLSAMVQIVGSLFGSYFIYKWSLKIFKIKGKESDFKWAMRFLLILSSSLISIVLFSEIGRFLDLSIFNGSEYTGIADRGRLAFAILIALGFCISDLVVNPFGSKLK